MLASCNKSAMSLRIRIIRTVVLLVLFITVTGLIISQPSCTRNAPSEQQVSQERLRRHVTVLSKQFIPRDYRHVENLNRCAEYIEEQFKQAGGQVARHEFEVEENVYRNVIATFGPPSDSRIIVGAHYDAFNDSQGADDNASGVAGLIELAHLLGQTELQQEVELVAFTLEEPPWFRTENMGSARYAAVLRAAGTEVEAMIALEMIGFFSDEKSSQRYPALLLKLIYPSRGNFIAVAGSMGDRRLIRSVKNAMKGATDLPVYSASLPKIFPALDFSDHLNFWQQGYTAVMVTDTAFYRNREYHGPNDTLDRLDFDRMAKVVLGVYEAVVHLANEKEG